MEAPPPRPAKGKAAKQQLQKQSSLEGAKSGASSSHEGLVDPTPDTPDDAAAAGMHSRIGPTLDNIDDAAAAGMHLRIGFNP